MRRNMSSSYGLRFSIFSNGAYRSTVSAYEYKENTVAVHGKQTHADSLLQKVSDFSPTGVSTKSFYSIYNAQSI